MSNSYPLDWRIVTLGDITALSQYGINSPSSQGNIYPMLRMNNIQDGSLDTTNLAYVELGSTEFEQYRLVPDDILINRTNSVELVGKSSIFQLSGDYVFASYLVRFRLTDEAYPLFVHYYLNSEMGQQILSSLATKGVSQANINPTTLKQRFLLPLPPLPEQRAIAAILSTWDEAITLTKRLIDALKQRKQALMQLLLTGEVRFAEFDGEWDSVEIGDVVEPIRRLSADGNRHKGRLVSVRRRSGGLFWRDDDQQGEGDSVIDEDATSSRLFQVKRGDFLISRRQVVHGAMGLVSAEFDGGYVSDSYAALIASDMAGFEIRFFDWLSKTREVYRLAYISSHGVHVEKLFFDLDTFLRHIVKVPPTKGEQVRIADILDTCETAIELNHKLKDRLTEQKRGLMQQLLTGTVRVQVVE